ncbi:MAG: T9SS type A sorting domain-containing protein [Cyclobacteriaceae bacterium]
MKSGLIIIALFAAVVCYSQPFITNDGISINNSAKLVVVNGDWVNDGNMLHNGSIKMTELFQHNGIMNPASTGGFDLTYTDTKTLVLGGKRIGFITLNGGGTIELPSDLRLRDSLNLKQGFIKMLNADDTLSLGPTALIKAAGATAYVKGVMMREGNGDRLFPVGNDSYYLPIKFYRVKGTSPKVTVNIEAAPAYTAGAAVTSLIGFPYAWRSHVVNPSDTASYVEIEYPDVLPSDPDVVVTRNASGQPKFEGMGRRYLTEVGGTVKVTSYSKGIRGLFSAAAGFPGNAIIDSLALVALYNGTNGTGWTNKTNWLTGPVATWFGVTQTGASITSINLPANQVSGDVPFEIIDLNALQNINLSDNEISSLPPVSQIEAISSLDVSGNKLDFSSLEANAGILTVDYLDQSILGSPSSTQVDVGTNYTLSVDGGGQADVYQWKLNGEPIVGAGDKNYQIIGINRASMGDYECEITNTVVPGLILNTAPQNVLAVANISGRLMTSPTTAASKGNMTLFKITSTGGYDTTAIKGINTDGTYLIDKVILDDYSLIGYADTITHINALPTYFEKTIYWEEADTLVIEDNLSNLDIVSEFKPGPPKNGTGQISGTFSEDDGSPGGRVLKNKRIQSAGATLRRAQRSSRGNEVTYTLVAYIFTNEQGEFVFDKLDPGEYRLNLQYPGYPMDLSSFIDIIVGTNLIENFVGVDAQIVGDKIVVRKRVITGWEESVTPYLAYPNPSRDLVHIQVKPGSRLDESLIQVRNLSGQVLDLPIHFSDESNEWLIDVSTLPFGTYLIRVGEKGEQKVLRLIVSDK